MKKFTIILLMFIMAFSTFAVTVNAASSTEYVKVKKATYQKYKKAYKNEAKLKKKIRKLEKKVADKQIAYEDAMDQYELALEDAKDKKSMNNWLWMNIKSLGITYSKKTWYVPTTFKSEFMINGATYKVIRED